MRSTIIALLVIVGCITFLPETSFAQKNKKTDKKERKKWKKEMKKTDPLEFRNMTEQLNVLKGESAGLKNQIRKLEADSQEFSTKMNAKNEELEQLKQKFAQLQEDCDNNVSASGDDYTKGIVYKVQVGAFRNKDLTKFMDKGNFWTEDEDGIKKYTIAYFRDYWEADTFKKYMREMGVKDAWIVAYEDNKRKDIKEVLGDSPIPNDKN